MSTANQISMFGAGQLRIEEMPTAPYIAGVVLDDGNIRDIEGKIHGLQYQRDFIGEDEEGELLQWIDRQAWRCDLKRRVQHYGWRYDYKARKIAADMRLGELPAPLVALAARLCQARLIYEQPDQVIVNEYQPGQGIAGHVDCESCFGETIITLSLGSGCFMDFTRATEIPPTQAQKIPVWLLPRSVIAMRGDARRRWLHGIAPRKSDEWQGVRYARGRRVSLTFRKVVFGGDRVRPY